MKKYFFKFFFLYFFLFFFSDSAKQSARHFARSTKIKQNDLLCEGETKFDLLWGVLRCFVNGLRILNFNWWVEWRVLPSSLELLSTSFCFWDCPGLGFLVCTFLGLFFWLYSYLNSWVGWLFPQIPLYRGEQTKFLWTFLFYADMRRMIEKKKEKKKWKKCWACPFIYGFSHVHHPLFWCFLGFIFIKRTYGAFY